MVSEELKQHLRNLSSIDHISQNHRDYLIELREKYNFNPSVIFDIGSCVLQWGKLAKTIWPQSKIYAFEAMELVSFLYEENNIEYAIGVFSDKDGKELTFYESYESPGGNSYYRENSWASDRYYGKNSERKVITNKIDTIVRERNFLSPDLIKIDVQGSELDILKGMENTLKSCKHLIIELQHEIYNKGAPLKDQSIPFIESLGFKLVTPLFCNNGPDGDYHFIKN